MKGLKYGIIRMSAHNLEGKINEQEISQRSNQDKTKERQRKTNFQEENSQLHRSLCDIAYQVLVLTFNQNAFFPSAVLCHSSTTIEKCLWNVNNKECISMYYLLTRTLPQSVNLLFSYFSCTFSSYLCWTQRFLEGTAKTISPAWKWIHFKCNNKGCFLT